jgi:hypothetical protein
MKRIIAPIIIVLALIGCQNDSIVGPQIRANPADRAGSPVLDVMTWNVYVGARVQDLLLISDPNLIPFEVARLFGEIQATNFTERADVIAAQIAAARPHVVGLNEVSLIRLQSPGDFLAGNPVQATIPVIDFLDILKQALVAHGANYVVAATVPNFDVEAPMVNFTTGGLDDVRLTDMDVILVRSDIEYSNPQAANFGAVLPIAVGGQPLDKPSGWVSVDLTVKGLCYRILEAHLEAADIAPGVVDPSLAGLQAAQASELLGLADASPYPVILMGDLNSTADGSSTTTYQDILDAGFVDAWTVGKPRGDGFTSGQDPDLRNPVSKLHHRIDFIFYRDDWTIEGGAFRGSVHIERIGEEQADRTTTGMWPSDHAGVLAAFRMAPGVRN